MQFKDFLNRVRTLNKDTINKLLHERLVSLEQNQDTKPIQKCLYVIEFSLNNNLTEIITYFKENHNVVNDVKLNFSSNKKINEICDNILILLGIQKKQEQTVNKELLRNKLTKGKANATNQGIDEIFNQGASNTTNSIQNQSEVNTQSIPDDIFDMTGGNSQSATTVNAMPENTQTQESQKKGFGFLKKKEQNKNTNNFPDIDFSNPTQTQTQNTVNTKETNSFIPSPEQVKKSESTGGKGGFAFVKSKKQETDNTTPTNPGLDMNFLDSQSSNLNINNSSSQSTQNKDKKLNLDDLLNQMYVTQPKNENVNTNQLNQNQHQLGNQTNQGNPMFNQQGYVYPPNNNQGYMGVNPNFQGGIHNGMGMGGMYTVGNTIPPMYNHNINQGGYNYMTSQYQPHPQQHYYNPNHNPQMNMNYNNPNPMMNNQYKSMFENQPERQDSDENNKKQKDNKFSFIDDLIQK